MTGSRITEVMEFTGKLVRLAEIGVADASGAAFAVILGDDEIAKQVATVKAMRGAGDEQQQTAVPFDDVVDYLVDQIVGGDDDHDHVHYHH